MEHNVYTVGLMVVLFNSVSSAKVTVVTLANETRVRHTYTHTHTHTQRPISYLLPVTT